MINYIGVTGTAYLVKRLIYTSVYLFILSFYYFSYMKIISRKIPVCHHTHAIKNLKRSWVKSVSFTVLESQWHHHCVNGMTLQMAMQGSSESQTDHASDTWSVCRTHCDTNEPTMSEARILCKLLPAQR